ncbi:MAG: hypothetical protein HC902_14115 [Calothrix sp. SM1_5_4]|nr:hypothetical protein [Calothrix sp. SM1_5_4]
MKAGSQFVAILKTHMYQSSWSQELTDYFKTEAENDDFVGYGEVIPHNSYTPMIFKTVFKNKQD